MNNHSEIIDEKAFYENIPDEAIPKHCPSCGEKLIRINNGTNVWIMPIGESKGDSFQITGFDTYCDSCEWSGDINPDFPEDLFIKKKEAESR